MGNLQVRFLEGWAPAMAPGYSTSENQVSDKRCVNRPNGLSTRMIFISVAGWFGTHIFYEQTSGDLATIPISSWRIAREGLFF